METINIPEGIVSIGNYAFKGCTALKSLSIPGTVTSIGNYAFMGAENLHTLVVPENVTSIGKHAFRGMTRAKDIMIPASVETVGLHAIYGAFDAVVYVYGGETVGSAWDSRWNSSYIPVVYGCTLSADKTYVVSFVKSLTNPDNMPIETSMTPPVREGYTFVGFSTTSGATTAEYDMSTLIDVPDGTLVYTVWAQEETPNN